MRTDLILTTRFTRLSRTAVCAIPFAIAVFFGTGSGVQDIGLTNNASVARTFNTKGTFTMTCTVHAGMSASITVQ